MLSRFMRGRSFLSKLVAEGFRSMVRRHENRNYNFATNGEEVVLRKLAKFGFSELFDVGGNVGDYSIMLRKYFPEAHIHTFEIVPDNAELIRNNLRGMSGIQINEIGLSNVNGNIRIKYFGKGSALNTQHDYPHKGPSEWIECPVQRGDDYLAENNIKAIDFLKIDTEGSENTVLEGFEQAFKNGAIRVVQFEYGYVNILAKYLLIDFYKFSVSTGMSLVKYIQNLLNLRSIV